MDENGSSIALDHGKFILDEVGNNTDLAWLPIGTYTTLELKNLVIKGHLSKDPSQYNVYTSNLSHTPLDDNDNVDFADHDYTKTKWLEFRLYVSPPNTDEEDNEGDTKDNNQNNNEEDNEGDNEDNNQNNGEDGATYNSQDPYSAFTKRIQCLNAAGRFRSIC